MKLSDAKVAVVGLGYVGLPLAVEFGKKRPVCGFDVNPVRVRELMNGQDRTGEVDPDDLRLSEHLVFSSDPEDLRDCQVFIIAVPTPVDSAKQPDLGLLVKATETVGRVMQPGAIVVYESTVYPGCTRGICVPALERTSGLTFNQDFFVGYSPERVNPGDKLHRLSSITKVTSGSTPEAAEEINRLYAEIITSGTYRASSIEVAEAAKVIENTQRDLNIALMNELSIIFHRLGLDTHEVLEAASTKWNFLPFSPGLVGGHCIGVDPYYLTHRAQEIGYLPEVILSGRRINDSMGTYVANRVARLMMKRHVPVVGSRILVMGLTFKENCPDIRNTKVVDIVHVLSEYNAEVDVWDPCADAAQVHQEYAIDLLHDKPVAGSYDGIIVAVAHDEFRAMGPDAIRALGREEAVIFDVKGILPKDMSDGRL